jgi:hypothetical protein
MWGSLKGILVLVAIAPMMAVADTDWLKSEFDNNEGNLSSEAKKDFWRDGMQTLCEEAQIPISFSLDGGDYVNFSAKYKRYIHAMPNKLYLVDRTQLKFSVGNTENLVDWGTDGAFKVGFGVKWDGDSYITRPLKARTACKELDRLIDPTDFKVIVPATAKRMKQMKPGESWKLPIQFHVSVRPAVGYYRDGVKAEIYFGHNRKGASGIVLSRLSENELRFRMSTSHLEVNTPGVSIKVAFKAMDWAKDFKEQLGDALGDIVGQDILYGQLMRWMEGYFNLSHSWIHSGEMVTEFVVDPHNREQMKTLENLLNGDIRGFGILSKLTKQAYDAYWDSPDRKSAEKSADELGDKLGLDPSFSGLIDSKSSRTSLGLKIPFIGDFKWSKTGSSLDKITILDKEDQNYRIYGALRESSAGLLDIPFLGTAFKFKSQDNVMIAGYLNPQDAAEAPIAVFVQQEGFVNFGNSFTEGMVERVNQVMQFAGVRGNGINARTILPLSVKPTDNHEMYRRGFSALTIVLTDTAMQSIRSASPLDVLRSYINAMSEDSDLKAVMASAVDNSIAIEHSSGALLDGRRIARDLNLTQEDRARVRAEFDTVTKLIGDIAKTGADKDGNMLTTEQQSVAWRDMVAGKSKARLPYADLMKVLLQLVNPKDLSAEFFFRVEDSAPEKDVNIRYLLFPETSRVEKVRRINDVLSHFRDMQNID